MGSCFSSAVVIPEIQTERQGNPLLVTDIAFPTSSPPPPVSSSKVPLDQCKCGKKGDEIVIPEKKSIQIFLRKFYCKACGSVW
jgi:hypothetical protein